MFAGSDKTFGRVAEIHSLMTKPTRGESEHYYGIYSRFSELRQPYWFQPIQYPELFKVQGMDVAEAVVCSHAESCGSDLAGTISLIRFTVVRMVINSR